MSRTWCPFSTERILRCSAVVLWAFVAWPASAVPSPVRSDPRYQTELPFGSSNGFAEQRFGHGEASPGGEAPKRFGTPSEGTPSRSGPGLGSFFASLGPGIAYLLLAAFGVGVVLLTIHLLLSQQRPDSQPEPGASAPAPPERRRPTTPADQLAAQGRWAEALQALLLDALVTLGERFRVPLPPARTSREALRVLPLKGDPHGALRDLVAAEERSLFGRSPVDATDYRRALELARMALGGKPS